MSVRLRPLGRQTVALRPGTSDIAVARETFLGGFHLPPEDLWGSISTVLDLGANIGLTVAHQAMLLPHARLLGVELDARNAALAERNVTAWAPRTTIICGAVWPHPGEVTYTRDPGNEYGLRVTDAARGARGAATARCLAVSDLIDRVAGAGGSVDYVKMDIEGAELEVLASAAIWAHRVRAMKVEVHPPYDITRCVADLNGLGFDAWIDGSHFGCVVALRRR